MPEQAPLGEPVIPLAEERVAVSRREVETGHVRVALTIETETVIARETLRGRTVEAERVPVNRTLPEGEPPPQSREEGDTLVVPVVEEVAVMVKRLVPSEEVRLRLVATETPFEEAVSVRRQRARVSMSLLPIGSLPRPPSRIRPNRERHQHMTQTVVALFDTVEAAERAAYDLATRVGGVRGEVYATSRAGELSSLDIPAEDTVILHENIRRGGAVLRAEVPNEKVQAVADAVEAAGAVDFEEREAAWRREGWTGWSGTDAATGSTATTGSTGTARDFGTTGGEERIPIVEERISVGKRETGHGRVRIRSYVVETPVQEQVTLREERVDIERRPVDRPIAAGDDAFRERAVEATETAEEAVVAKEARVTEEVVVRKTAEERTETVSDTVRRTEVEIEDERGRTTGTPEQRRDRT